MYFLLLLMGILLNDLKLLLDARSRGASFEKTLTLARLSMNVQRHDLEKILVQSKLKPATGPTFYEQYGTGCNADDLLRLLGARVTDSIDNSNFEGATIIHDLNKPLPQHLVNQYDCVIDGGTIEHVFNFPVALHNAMQAVKVGGRLFIFQMANNCVGHGFYTLSPELFSQAFVPAYGFEMERLLTYEYNKSERVYVVPQPGAIGRNRVYIRSNQLLFIIIEARKIGDSSKLLDNPPQQFDYAQQWDKAGKPVDHTKPAPGKPRKHSFLHDMPWYARWQSKRQHNRRNSKGDRLFSLTNSEIFKPYRFEV